jgi:DNA replication and repair protein RecF
MRLDALTLHQFRSYEQVELAFDEKSNVIYGENAQGKTNLLEAAVYLSCGKSPRARSDSELIRFDTPAAALEGTITARERTFHTKIDLTRGRKRKISVNGVPLKRAAELSDVLHTVFFCPDDLYLIRAGAAERRRFLDTALCQLRPRYAAALARYNRAYEHKTRILRDSEDKPSLLETLPEFNEELCVTGAMLIHYRAQYCEKLREYAQVAHQECSGGREELGMTYETVSNIHDPAMPIEELAQALRDHMTAHQSAERASRLCLSGPHKDDLVLSINGRSAKSFSSQGQTRTAALSLKLAEREIHKNAVGEYPVLLLDDVLSELDERRQEYVLNRIAGGQIFITCCENDRLSAMLQGKVFHIRGGKVL